ncbi:MAG TPA: peptidoglycan DD-metalloendopeptidase family protein [Desulfobacterales bacterium]|nr:peptidoglycan DD-metalloendopeptidase family protein [Desulfobacterales bacterium]
MALKRAHLKGWIGKTGLTPASPAVARCVSALLILCLTGLLGEADAQSPQSSAGGERGAIETLREEADALRQDIQQQEAELDRVARDEGDIAGALEAAARSLQRHRRRTAALKAELDELEQNIASTATTVADLSRRIRAGEAAMSGRLVALYKVSSLGTAQLLASADSVAEFVQRRKALGQILAQDERAREALMAQQAELAELREHLERQQAEKRTRAGEYERQLASAGREKVNREQLLAQIRNRKELQLAAIDTLRQSARALDEQIGSLGRRAVSGTDGGHRPAKPFSDSKGLLLPPVKGKIVSLYGPFRDPQFNAPAFRSGIEIAADRGDPVQAVHSGKIIYASWFKGYGNVLIIDHGSNFYTVYAHLEDVFKSVDNPVEAREVVATVGDSGAMGTAGLYFELRHHGNPLDPLEWFKRGHPTPGRRAAAPAMR